MVFEYKVEKLEFPLSESLQNTEDLGDIVSQYSIETGEDLAKPYKKKKGITLTELLISIGIIAVLAGIILPVYSGARKRANLTRCTEERLKEISYAIQEWVYRDTSSPRLLPPGLGEDNVATDIIYIREDGKCRVVGLGKLVGYGDLKLEDLYFSDASVSGPNREEYSLELAKEHFGNGGPYDDLTLRCHFIYRGQSGGASLDAGNQPKGVEVLVIENQRDYGETKIKVHGGDYSGIVRYTPGGLAHYSHPKARGLVLKGKKPASLDRLFDAADKAVGGR